MYRCDEVVVLCRRSKYKKQQKEGNASLIAVLPLLPAPEGEVRIFQNGKFSYMPFQDFNNKTRRATIEEETYLLEQLKAKIPMGTELIVKRNLCHAYREKLLEMWQNSRCF